MRWLLTLLAAAAIVGASVVLVRTAMFVSSARRASGQVVGYDVVEDRFTTTDQGRPRERHYPTIEFRTDDGRLQRFSAGDGTAGQRYALGETVPVLYSPGQPERAEIAFFLSLWGGALGCAFFAVLLSAVAISHFRAHSRERRYTVGQVVRLKGD